MAVVSFVRRWRAGFTVVVVVPVALLAAAEGAARLAGLGHDVSFFVPTGDGRTVMSNRRFGWSYMARETATAPHAVLMEREKPEGTRRVFVLGESAAMGTPEPAFGFVRILETMFRHQYPSNRVEVINAAMRGINSHAIRRIVRDCARYSPDLFVVYAGNNERVGYQSPEPDAFTLTAYPRWIRMREWVMRLRLAQAFAGLFQARDRSASGAGSAERPEPGMEFFRRKRMSADDPRQRAVDRNFEANLREVVEVATGSGAGVVLATVAVNLRDFPPLGSLTSAGLSPADRARWETAFAAGREAEVAHRPDEARNLYRSATGIDGGHAEAWYRLGRVRLAGGDREGAGADFVRARDLDALPFRTDTRLNGVIRSVAGAGRARVTLVDVEGALGSRADAEGGIPGERLFTDHVHFTFEGDYRVARAMAGEVAGALGLGEPVRPMPSQAECAGALAYTEWEDLGVRAAILRMLARPPFLDQADHTARQQAKEGAIEQGTRTYQQTGGPRRTVAAYRAAVERRPDDWMIRSNFGDAWSDFGNLAGAAEEYGLAVRHMPVLPRLRANLAQALWKLGRNDAAVEQLEAALQLDPAAAGAREGLAAIRGAGARP